MHRQWVSFRLFFYHGNLTAELMDLPGLQTTEKFQSHYSSRTWIMATCFSRITFTQHHVSPITCYKTALGL